jgi:ABC-2 type transport system ATP-binding protein
MTEVYGTERLVVRYGGTTALDDVSVDVPAGDVVAVVGGDGAGKTTLLRTLVGAVTPAAGSVRRPPLREIGFMPTTSGVWRELTVDENAQFVGGVYGLHGTELRRRRDRLLGAAGLADVGDRLAGRLSGGMRQKLAFSLAMLHDPALLVLDEPSTGIDPVSRVDLWRLVTAAAVGGTAVLMSTTYLDEAERAGTVLVLDRGRVLLSGAPEEVVAAAPGTVVETDRPVDRGWSWRRGRRFHAWHPGPPAAGDRVVERDLEDAVVAAALADRAAVSP